MPAPSPELTGHDHRLCQQLARMVDFQSGFPVPEDTDDASERLREEMRKDYFDEYVAEDSDWHDDSELCQRTRNDAEFLSRFDDDLARDGYSDAALELQRSTLKAKFMECCRAVHTASNDAGAIAQRDFRAANEKRAGHQDSETNFDAAFDAIDRLNPLLLAIFERWENLGFTARDLDLIRR